MRALHLAAGRRDARVVEAIISRNPECYELVDNWGWNFLHYALFSFKVEELRNLVDNMLASSFMNERDAKGNTPVHFFAVVYRKEIFDDLSRRVKATIKPSTTIMLALQNVGP